MADVAHIGGLIAAGVMRNPFDYDFDIVTTTSHKTLRGPRAGLVMCKEKYAKEIDKSVFPGLQGGPHMQTIAAIAVALKKAMEPEFKEYANQVLKNAKVLAESLMENRAKLITNGTENHMMVVNTIDSFGIDGADAEHVLDQVSLTVNKQIIPDDPNPALRPSGIRLGTPAATTRGMRESEMKQIAKWIISTIEHRDNVELLDAIKNDVEEMCSSFPVPGL